MRGPNWCARTPRCAPPRHSTPPGGTGSWGAVTSLLAAACGVPGHGGWGWGLCSPSPPPTVGHAAGFGASITPSWSQDQAFGGPGCSPAAVWAAPVQQPRPGAGAGPYRGAESILAVTGPWQLPPARRAHILFQPTWHKATCGDRAGGTQCARGASSSVPWHSPAVPPAQEPKLATAAAPTCSVAVLSHPVLSRPMAAAAAVPWSCPVPGLGYMSGGPGAGPTAQLPMVMTVPRRAGSAGTRRGTAAARAGDDSSKKIPVPTPTREWDVGCVRDGGAARHRLASAPEPRTCCPSSRQAPAE